MISERENFQLMLDGKQPEFVPAAMNLFDLVLPSIGTDRPVNCAEGIDGFGVKWIAPEGEPPMPDTQQDHVLKDICDWREVVKFPDLDAVDWEACAKRDLALCKPAQLTLVQLTSGPTERIRELMGYENALCAMMEDPEECEAFIEAFCDWRIREIQLIAKYYKPDMIQFQDDWGTQQNLMFMPDFWRDVVKPNIKRCIDACHDCGVLFDMHSCGKIDLIIDELVELEPDMIDSVMVCNDLDGWMERFGRKVVFLGGVDTQGVIDRVDSTKEQIRGEMKYRMDRYCPKANFIPMPYGTNTKNMVEAMMFAARYGYKFGGAKHGTLRFLKMLPHAMELKNRTNTAAGL